VQALAELEMSGDFVLQLHWWGEASHYDLRMGKNHGWFGFTIPGPGKEALESKDGADLKEGLELGKKFLALKKEYYGGKEWLEYGKEEIKEFPPGDKPTEGNPSTRLTAYMKAVDWGKYKLEKRIENELIIEFDGVKGVLSGRYFIIVAPESMQEKGAAEKWLISKAKEQEVKEISLQNSEQLSLKTLNGEQHIIDVTIIRPGPAKINLEGMKVIYTEEVLEKSLPLWNGAACFADHFNKSVRNIVGVFYDARYEEGVKAKLRFTDPSIFHLLQQILADREEGLPVPNIGISADINIKGIPIAGNIEVQEIINVISADIVFAPAAGGSFDRVLNSVRQQHGISDDPEKRIRDLQATADKLRAQVKNQEAQLQEALEQHKRDLLKDHPEIPEEMLTGTSIAELNASLEKASQLVERVKKNLEVQSIPIGAPVRSAPDIESLSPTEKIKYALRKET
jgi:hypothetical protein